MWALEVECLDHSSFLLHYLAATGDPAPPQSGFRAERELGYCMRAIWVIVGILSDYGEMLTDQLQSMVIPDHRSVALLRLLLRPGSLRRPLEE